MGELEELLGDLGCKQWVKNQLIAKIKQFQKEGSTNVDKLVDEFNHEILRDFKKIAQETVDETLKKAATLMEKEA